MSSRAGLTFVDVEGMLRLLGPLSEEIVLVGGQAVNFWADFFVRSPTMSGVGLLTSKDIDFCGHAQQVRRCAKALGGSARIATMDDVTANTGVVLYRDAHGVERHIDFLDAPFGLSAAEVALTAQRMQLLDGSGNWPAYVKAASTKAPCAPGRLPNSRD